VTQSGENSRLVTFDVSLAVTNTLENMNVVFDLSTNDDITVQNELASMSPEQRANQAMNLLLYKVYSGSGTKATANIGGNPLFSFLTSQLNSWAANNIKGVDISFGIDQYDRTLDGSTSTTTSYNYRVSKSLFNDRFKIMVGGNYSTDANADENFSQNLINDISFEYMLNKSGSMYIRVFRHTGYESILEGEITQTGVGFVLKRKLNSLRELFGIKRD
ncbi:MAG: translocation/assembly module TamB domain-containing protein, partial [Duncaniella sp.]|nr:translocation/assembly module TamB domain-containing protein [Duncaniella sp.]